MSDTLVVEPNDIGPFEPVLRHVRTAIAVAMSLFHIWALGFTVLQPWFLTAIHILFATVLIFLYFPLRASSIPLRLLDIACALLAVVTYLYVLYDYEGLLGRAGFFPNTPDLIFGISSVLLTLEVTRRTTGWAMPIVAIAALVYARYGDALPGILGHRDYSAERIVSFVFGLDGIFSSALQVSATYIFLFVLFGAFLQTSGAGEFFLKLASSAVGTIRGGPAKVAIFASALFGTISGSAVANTASTGAVTIPMMKRSGYPAHFAAAVEAVASTGGQIMPPIMGAGAFIIADIVGVSYWTVAIAAIIPALLFFATAYFGVDFEAQKRGLRGLDRSELPVFRQVLMAEGYLLLPILVLLFSLTVLLNSPIRAALLAVAATVVVSFCRAHTRLGPKKLIEALTAGARGALEVAAACACAGIVVGVLNLTGLGQIIASVVVDLSQGIVLLALVLSMVVCIVLGMGLPTTPAYIIAASVVAPGLIKLGVPPLQAHLFVFYFACIAVITPPVALASYTAAAIAKAPPMKVSMTAVKLGIAAFIIPYFFVFNEALIGQGTIVQVGIALATALVGIYFLAAGVAGYFLRPLPWLVRLCFIVGSVLLIKPGWITDAIGVGLVIGGFAFAVMTRKKMRSAAVTQ
ncbi:MAG: TRAP transporter permease [Pseudolabrys sp.]|nr:TRAP transporter permease [Pseudolabrys sp.]MDP2298478.1 TRAP transporter permease [Pseudolabrys sp.]